MQVGWVGLACVERDYNNEITLRMLSIITQIRPSHKQLSQPYSTTRHIAQLVRPR